MISSISMTWPPGASWVTSWVRRQTIATNELLTGLWPGLGPANLDQSCEILLLVCVLVGAGLRGSKWYYFGSSITARSVRW